MALRHQRSSAGEVATAIAAAKSSTRAFSDTTWRARARMVGSSMRLEVAGRGVAQRPDVGFGGSELGDPVGVARLRRANGHRPRPPATGRRRGAAGARRRPRAIDSRGAARCLRRRRSTRADRAARSGTPRAACSAAWQRRARAIRVGSSAPSAKAQATSRAALDDSPEPAGRSLCTVPSNPAAGRNCGDDAGDVAPPLGLAPQRVRRRRGERPRPADPHSSSRTLVEVADRRRR